MVKVYCDRCGQEVESGNHLYDCYYEFTVNSRYETYSHISVCKGCLDKVGVLVDKFIEDFEAKEDK